MAKIQSSNLIEPCHPLKVAHTNSIALLSMHTTIIQVLCTILEQLNIIVKRTQVILDVGLMQTCYRRESEMDCLWKKLEVIVEVEPFCHLL